MEGIKSVFIKTQKINTVIISLDLLVMVKVVFLQTLYRFVISRGLSWSEELSRYLFVTLTVLGVDLVITNHLFVRIKIVDSYLRGTAAVMMNLTREFIMICVNIVFVYSSSKLILIGAYQASPAMRVPIGLLHDIVFIGFTMNVFASLIDLCETYVGVSEREVK